MSDSGGRLFHAAGAAYENVRCPDLSSLIAETVAGPMVSK